jgi:hypothetical protein
VHYADKLLAAKNKKRNLFINNKLLKMEVLDPDGWFFVTEKIPL